MLYSALDISWSKCSLKIVITRLAYCCEIWCYASSNVSTISQLIWLPKRYLVLFHADARCLCSSASLTDALTDGSSYGRHFSTPSAEATLTAPLKFADGPCGVESGALTLRRVVWAGRLFKTWSIIRAPVSAFLNCLAFFDCKSCPRAARISAFEYSWRSEASRQLWIGHCLKCFLSWPLLLINNSWHYENRKANIWGGYSPIFMMYDRFDICTIHPMKRLYWTILQHYHRRSELDKPVISGPYVQSSLLHACNYFINMTVPALMT